MSETHPNAFRIEAAQKRAEATRLNDEADQLEAQAEVIDPTIDTEVEDLEQKPEKPLSKMNRAELNAKAIEVGVESPEDLSTNKDVIEAIQGEQS